MTRSRPFSFLLSATVLPLAALAVAACGGGGAATAAPAHAGPKPTTTKLKPAAVRVATGRLGNILVNSQGRTLYLFKGDVGTESRCTGACAAAWPPLLTSGNATAGNGAKPSLIGTTIRSNGNRQVTYNGHPLYLFIKDMKPGETKGQGITAFGAAWFVVSPAGNQISGHLTGHRSASPARRAVPPAAKPAPKPAAPPVAKPKPPASNGIPQNNGGDGDSDNNGGPSDGDGSI